MAIALLLAVSRPFPPYQQFENTRRRGQVIEAKILVSHPADHPFLALGVSGGGLRASALAYFVLKELAAMRYVAAETEHHLIDDIKIVSSVSGGSVTAAFFALNGAAGLDRLYDDFLTVDNNARLVLEAASPVTAGKLLFSNYSRAMLLADYLDRRLFAGAPFGVLRDPGRPLLILNATDMVDGSTFSFSPATFNALCAEFDTFRVAVGVAASAAFPIAFTPLTLKNYSGPGCPGWQREGSAEFVNDNYVDRLLQYYHSLYRGEDARRAVDYVHLIDGGLSDNLALSPLEQMIRKPIVLGFANHMESQFPLGRVVRRGLVIIAVNSRVSTETRLDQRGTAPGIGDVARSVINLPMSSSSVRTQEAIESLIADVNWAYRERDRDPDPRKKAVWFFRVDLDDLHGLCSPEFVRAVNAIPTSWSVTAEQLRLLRAAARRLLVQAGAEYASARRVLRTSSDSDVEDLALCVGRPVH